jgi:hypothetical protein
VTITESDVPPETVSKFERVLPICHLLVGGFGRNTGEKLISKMGIAKISVLSLAAYRTLANKLQARERREVVKTALRRIVDHFKHPLRPRGSRRFGRGAVCISVSWSLKTLSTCSCRVSVIPSGRSSGVSGVPALVMASSACL